MARLSEKYIAGFLDADGYIGLSLKGGKYKPLLKVGFSQKTSNDKVLLLIQEVVGGAMRVKTVKNVEYSELVVTGKAAEKALNRIKKHLVLKRRYADVCIELVERRVPLEPKLTSAYLKVQRKIQSLPLPNFPPRKWLAGYVDGDGCFSCGTNKQGGCSVILSIAASSYDTEGITIIQKSFGGKIRGHSQNPEGVKQLSIGLGASKAKQFIGYFAKHLITKKDQAYFILGCAEMGHYRDGKNIKSALKQLKAQNHRLSEHEADIKTLLSMVRDIPHRNTGNHNLGKRCKSV